MFFKSAASLLSLTRDIGIADVFDIGLMSLVIYVILSWFKRRRAAFILFGIIICGLIYLAAHQFRLVLVSTVLQAFFAVILIALIIIFQEELRSFFEQIAVWSLNRKFRRREAAPSQKIVDVLVRTLADFSRERIGALIVLQGSGILDRHVFGGQVLDGELSEPLLKSIFDPHSIGHDGAIVIDRDRVKRFGVHLPLSRNAAVVGRGGMRHAAAVGLSELSDALCLVASEETGKLSIALHGELIRFNPGETAPLRKALEEFYGHTSALKKRGVWSRFILKNYKEKIAAVLITLALWYVVVHESRVIRKTFAVPIEYAQPATGLYVETIEPAEAQITFSGPRHAFRFLDPSDVRAVLRLHDYGDGTWAIPLNEANVSGPKETVLEEIDPTLIMIEIEKR